MSHVMLGAKQTDTKWRYTRLVSAAWKAAISARPMRARISSRETIRKLAKFIPSSQSPCGAWPTCLPSAPSPLFAERNGGRVLALRFWGRSVVLRFVADGDAHDLNGVADHVGGAALALWAAADRVAIARG